MLQRTRVLERCGHARLLFVEAPSGYGKTTLVDQLCVERPALRVDLSEEDRTTGRAVARLIRVASHDHALTAAAASAGAADPTDRLAEVAAALVRLLPQSSLVVLDDVHHLEPGACAALVSGLLSVLVERNDVGLVVAARALPDIDLGELDDRVPTVRIGATDLAFDRSEVGALVGLDHAAVCRRMTEGWPAAVALWAEHGAGIDARAPTHVLDAVVRHLLEPLAPARRAALRALRTR